MDAAHKDVMLRRLAVGWKHRRLGTAFRDVDDFGRRVAVDLGEVRKRGFDLEPAILFQGAGDESAAALLGFDDPVARQQIDRLPNGDAGDAELDGEQLVRRQSQALGPNSARDPLTKNIGNLGVFRNVAV
jgi:hypothetical protein